MIKLQDTLPLFIFDMANNHMGDIEHGKDIINELAYVCKSFDYNIAIKFQYRDLDTFIHKDYKESKDYKYVKRFLSTRLSWDQFLELKNLAKDLGLLTACTPFDEISVDKVEEHNYDILKVASASCTDWPLLERVAKTNMPIVISTAGASLTDIDGIVSFFIHRNKDLAVLHCVAEYPTMYNDEELNQISLLKSRYPGIIIGWSSHESPYNMAGVGIAIAKGAQVFERHLDVSNYKYRRNHYSLDPFYLRKWLTEASTAFGMCGSQQREDQPDKLLTDLRSLRRGVWAKRDLPAGTKIGLEDVYFAIPIQEGQIEANNLSKYVDLETIEEILQDKPIELKNLKISDHREKVNEIISKVKDLLKKSGAIVPSMLDLEISHHYGMDKFNEYGCVLITFINKSYCKKLILVLPGQTHPAQYHQSKDETFHLLYGDLDVKLNGIGIGCKPGDIIDVPINYTHSFSSKDGAIIEEISSKQCDNDSFYTDQKIMDNKNRKTLVTNWIGR